MDACMVRADTITEDLKCCQSGLIIYKFTHANSIPTFKEDAQVCAFVLVVSMLFNRKLTMEILECKM